MLKSAIASLILSSSVLSVPLPVNAMMQEEVQYSYDELARLTKVCYVSSGKSITYVYDKAGNRTSKTVANDPACNSSTPARFEINNVTVTEGGVATFTVTRLDNTTGANNVNFASANGSALAGSDYVTSSGILSFASGNVTKTISISTIDDAQFEGNEVFYVNLSGATGGAVISISQGAATITDNDVANTAPVAVDDSATGVAGTASTVNVLANDTDADGDALTIQSISAPGSVTASITADNKISVTAYDVGSYIITYVVSDGKGGTDTGTLTYTIPDAPDPCISKPWLCE